MIHRNLLNGGLDKCVSEVLAVERKGFRYSRQILEIKSDNKSMFFDIFSARRNDLRLWVSLSTQETTTILTP